MYGMIVIATAGWTSGTLLGGICGDVLPAILTNALGVMLYGMFIAVIIPPIREGLHNLAVVIIAAIVSCIIYFGLPQISGGFAIIISAIVAAVIMAIVHPIEDEDEAEDELKSAVISNGAEAEENDEVKSETLNDGAEDDVKVKNAVLNNSNEDKEKAKGANA